MFKKLKDKIKATIEEVKMPIRENRHNKALEEIGNHDDNTKQLLEVLKNDDIGSVFINGVFGSGKTRTWINVYNLLTKLTYNKKTKEWEIIPWYKKCFSTTNHRLLNINFYEEYNHNNWYEFLYFKIRGLKYLWMFIISSVILWLVSMVGHNNIIFQKINETENLSKSFIVLLISIVFLAIIWVFSLIYYIPILFYKILKIQSFDFFDKLFKKKLQKYNFIVIDDFDRVNSEEMYQQIKLVSYIYNVFIKDLDQKNRFTTKLIMIGELTKLDTNPLEDKHYQEQLDKFIHTDFEVKTTFTTQFSYYVDNIQKYINDNLSLIEYNDKTIAVKKVDFSDFFNAKCSELEEKLQKQLPSITWRNVQKTICTTKIIIDDIIKNYNTSLYSNYIDNNPAFIVDNENVFFDALFSGINWLKIFFMNCNNHEQTFDFAKNQIVQYEENKEKILDMVRKKSFNFRSNNDKNHQNQKDTNLMVKNFIDEICCISSIGFNQIDYDVENTSTQKFTLFNGLKESINGITLDDRYLALLMMSRTFWKPFDYGFNSFQYQSDSSGIDLMKCYAFDPIGEVKYNQKKSNKYNSNFLINLLIVFMFINLEFTLDRDYEYFDKSKSDFIKNLYHKNELKSFSDILDFFKSISNFSHEYGDQMGLSECARPFNGDKHGLFNVNTVYNFTNTIILLLEYLVKEDNDFINENKQDIVKYLNSYGIDGDAIPLKDSQKQKINNLLDDFGEENIQYNGIEYNEQLFMRDYNDIQNL